MYQKPKTIILKRPSALALAFDYTSLTYFFRLFAVSFVMFKY